MQEGRGAAGQGKSRLIQKKSQILSVQQQWDGIYIWAAVLVPPGMRPKEKQIPLTPLQYCLPRVREVPLQSHR